MNNRQIQLAIGLWLLGIVMVGWIQPFYALLLTMLFAAIFAVFLLWNRE